MKPSDISSKQPDGAMSGLGWPEDLVHQTFGHPNALQGVKAKYGLRPGFAEQLINQIKQCAKSKPQPNDGETHEQ